MVIDQCLRGEMEASTNTGKVSIDTKLTSLDEFYYSGKTRKNKLNINNYKKRSSQPRFACWIEEHLMAVRSWVQVLEGVVWPMFCCFLRLCKFTWIKKTLEILPEFFHHGGVFFHSSG